MAAEEIGAVSIGVDVDFSDLDAQFNSAVQKAVSDSQQLASAIQSSVTAPDIGPVTGAFEQVSSSAKDAGQTLTQAFQVSVEAPDITPILDSFSNIDSAAQQTLQQMQSYFADVPLPALDTSAILDSLTAIDAAAQQAIEQTKADFSSVPLQPLDTTPVTDSLTSIDTFAQASLDQMEQYFANAPLPPLNITPISDSLSALADAAGALKTPLDDVANEIDKENKAAFDGQAALQALVDKFNDGEISVKEYISATNALSDAVKAMGDDLDNLPPKFNETTDSLHKFSLGAQDLVDQQQKADDALKQAQNVLAEIQVAYERGAADADVLARAEQNVASAFDAANPAIDKTKSAVDAGTESMKAMNQVLGALGVTLGLGAFVKFAESIGEAYDSITKADIALTKITGDAGSAADILDRLDKLGVSDGLSLPGLQKAATAMSAILPVGTDVVGTLGQLADASVVSGKSIDALASTFDRVAESGKLNARALKDFGLNIGDLKGTFDDLGISLGKFSGDAIKAFNSLSENDQIVVLQTALLKLQGTAEDVANNTFTGAWGKAAAQFDSDIKLIIKDYGDLTGKIPDLTPVVNAIGVVFIAVGGTVKAVIDNITNDIVGLQVQLTGLGKASLDALSGNFKQAGKDISDAMSLAASVTKQAAVDWNTDIANMKKAMSDLENQTKTSTTVVIGNLDGIGKGAKDASDKIAAAVTSIKTFVSQIDAGGTVSQLQKDFENASKAINTVAKEDLPLAISALQKYNQAQVDNGAKSAVLLEGFQKESTLISQLAKVDLPAAIDASNRLFETYKNANVPIGLVTAAFEQQEKLINQLAKEDYPAAIAAQEQLVAELSKSPQYANLLRDAIDQLSKMVDAHAKSLDAAVTSQIKFADQITKTALAIPDIQGKIKAVTDALDAFGDSALKAPPKISPLNQAMIDFGINAGKAKTAAQDLSTPIEKLTTDLGDLVAKAQASGDWGPVLQALDDFDKRVSTIAKTDLPEAVKQMEAWIKSLQDHKAPAEIVQGQLDKLAPLIQKMAKEDLPGAAAAWKTYLDMLNQVGPAQGLIVEDLQHEIDKDQEVVNQLVAHKAAYYDIVAASGAAAAAAVDYANKTGVSNDLAVGSLEKTKLATKELQLGTVDLMTVYVQGINDVIKGYEQLGATMADAIVNGKNLGQALIDQFKKIAQAILGDLIQGALAPLEKDLVHLFSSTLPGFTAAQQTASGATTALGAASTTAAGAQTVLAGSATITTGALAAMGIASALAAIQLNTLITAIAAAIGAIAAIMGDVYLAAIDTKLFHIETSLLAIQNDTANARKDAWDQFNQTYSRIGEVLDRLNHIMDSTAAIAASFSGISAGGNQQVNSDIHDMAGNIATLIDIERGIVGHFDTIDRDFNAGLQNVASILGNIYSILTRIAANSATSQSLSQSMSESLGTMSDRMATGTQALSDTIERTGGNTDGRNVVNTNTIHTDFINAINTANGQLAAAKSANDEMNALSAEYQAAQTAMNQALAIGDTALAQQYQRQMQEIMGQIASFQEQQSRFGTAQGDVQDQQLQALNDQYALLQQQLTAAQLTLAADTKAGANSDKLVADSALISDIQLKMQSVQNQIQQETATNVDYTKELAGASSISASNSSTLLDVVSTGTGNIVSAVNASATTIAQAIAGNGEPNKTGAGTAPGQTTTQTYIPPGSRNVNSTGGATANYPDASAGTSLPTTQSYAAGAPPPTSDRFAPPAPPSTPEQHAVPPGTYPDGKGGYTGVPDTSGGNPVYTAPPTYTPPAAPTLPAVPVGSPIGGNSTGGSTSTSSGGSGGGAGPNPMAPLALGPPTPDAVYTAMAQAVQDGVQGALEAGGNTLPSGEGIYTPDLTSYKPAPGGMPETVPYGYQGGPAQSEVGPPPPPPVDPVKAAQDAAAATGKALADQMHTLYDEIQTATKNGGVVQAQELQNQYDALKAKLLAMTPEYGPKTYNGLVPNTDSTNTDSTGAKDSTGGPKPLGIPVPPSDKSSGTGPKPLGIPVPPPAEGSYTPPPAKTGGISADQQAALTAAMDWLNAQQGISDADKAISAKTFADDAAAGDLPTAVHANTAAVQQQTQALQSGPRALGIPSIDTQHTNTPPTTSSTPASTDISSSTPASSGTPPPAIDLSSVTAALATLAGKIDATNAALGQLDKDLAIVDSDAKASTTQELDAMQTESGQLLSALNSGLQNLQNSVATAGTSVTNAIISTASFEGQLLSGLLLSYPAKGAGQGPTSDVAIGGSGGGGIGPMPSFDVGGLAPDDMIAMIHRGEAVLPPDLTAMLRRAASQPAMDSAIQRTGANIVVNAPITINGAQDGQTMAKTIVRHLKLVVPQGGLTS